MPRDPVQPVRAAGKLGLSSSKHRGKEEETTTTRACLPCSMCALVVNFPQREGGRKREEEFPPYLKSLHFHIWGGEPDARTRTSSPPSSQRPLRGRRKKEENWILMRPCGQFLFLFLFFPIPEFLGPFSVWSLVYLCIAFLCRGFSIQVA